MKKIIAMLIVLCLTLCMIPAAFAESVEANVIDQLRNIVREYLDEEGYTYEYDETYQTFTLDFGLNCALETVSVTIYLYDDMIAVSVDSPLQITEANFENAAIFTTLANNEIYYAQFRVDLELGYLTCRSCQMIETVVPDVQEINTLFVMPLVYMETYGDGIAQISEGGDPYEAFEVCLTAGALQATR